MPRVRKPSGQLKVTGQYREDRHGGRADESYDGEPKQLHGLGEDGRWLWNEITRNTPPGILAAIDTAQLFAVCRWWQRYRTADRKNDTRSFIQANQAWQNFNRIASEYGLTPAARAKLKAPTKEHEDDPYEAMMRARETA